MKVILTYTILTIFFSVIIMSWIELIVKYIRKNKRKKKYPRYVCRDCGIKFTGGKCFKIPCWYEGRCDVCRKIKIVTEVRDFYYPEFK